MAQSDTASQRSSVATAGNTNCRRRSRGYMLTINNFTIEDETNIRNIGADRWIYQVERGEEHGTVHIQLFLYFNNPMDWNTIKRWWNTAHIEVARANGHSIKYCSKPETRVRGPYYHNIELPNQVEVISEFREWQEELLEYLDQKPDHRKIRWYYDAIGGTGKTAICKYLCVTRDDCIYVSGKANDMKFAITQAKKKPTIILIDVSRSQEKTFSYQGIEEIKNGIFFCGKYESQMFIMNNPHVICFANFEPNKKALSIDRWDIINLTSGNSDDSQIN